MAAVFNVPCFYDLDKLCHIIRFRLWSTFSCNYKVISSSLSLTNWKKKVWKTVVLLVSVSFR